ncbi:MAG TPA: type II toxin-antitoxin system prevent-host-death family antitoxin [Solirubrobacterales bacterium]|jgi:prevent-host-death family protein|nr:type II toxin-antitoxin system prevent-host-death family antitoxin [Solirubrobacterales bacterium]
MAIRVRTETVGHRRLKNHLSEVLRETLDRGEAVPISNRGTVDGYLMPPGVVEELDRAERLRETLPLLMAAVASGAAIPSQTLRDIGVEIPLDWKALNRFTARTPVAFTQGEGGEPWIALPDAQPEPMLEDEADFEL